MLRDPKFDRIRYSDGWQAASLENASVSIEKDSTDPNHPALKATIDKVDGTDWHAQVSQTDLTVDKGSKYTLSFTAKASAARKIAVFIQEQEDPYSLLTEGESIELTTEAKPQKVQFAATNGSDGAKLTIVLGDATGTVVISDISLVKN
jgi:hypothetical protein